MRKLKLFPRFLVAIGTLVILSTGLVASAENQTVNLSLGTVMTWTFTGSTLTFSSIVPGVAQTQAAGATYLVSSNVGWKIMLYGTDFVDASSNVIPITSLGYRIGTTGLFTPVPSGSGSAIQFETGTISQTVKTIQYQLLVPAGPTYSAGTYSGALTYTFSAV